MIDWPTVQKRLGVRAGGLTVPTLLATPDPIDITVIYSKHLAEAISAFRGCSNILYQLRRVFSGMMRLSERLRSMFMAIEHITDVRIPAKIRRNIVRRLSVVMAGIRFFIAILFNKGFCDETMNPKGFFLSDADTDFDLKMTARHYVAGNKPTRLSPFAGGGSAHPSETTYLIIRRLRNSLPNFNGIEIDVSHGAVPSRGGQGRAVFPAPLRSAEFSRFPAKEKAA